MAGTGITSASIKNLLRGPGSSKVSIKLLRGNSVKVVELQRGTIPIVSVDAAYMINDTTGFIHLNKFSSTSYEECMAAFENLKARGMRKLIFDLRDNSGGILAEAVDISDEFLSGEKLIVYTRGDKQEKIEYNCRRPGQFEDGSLVILIDENSASASEVLAGAVQDWDRGIIVGRRSFGKGLVQEQYELSSGSALRLTVARYYTPTGRSIQKSYAGGRIAYNGEVAERFNNGEVMHEDTTIHGEKFTTKGGRTVYGGGGITPDIFVAYDTTGFQADVTPLFANQNFGKFIYRYYISNKAFFEQFRDAADFSKRFTPDAASLRYLDNYAAANKITLPIMNANDRNELAKRIKTWMARQIWGMPGYYEVANSYDLTVQRALETK